VRRTNSVFEKKGSADNFSFCFAAEEQHPAQMAGGRGGGWGGGGERAAVMLQGQ